MKKEKESKTEVNNENTLKKTVLNTNKNTTYEEISVVPSNWNPDNFSESFDVIPLPSKGECYGNYRLFGKKCKTLRARYLLSRDQSFRGAGQGRHLVGL